MKTMLGSFTRGFRTIDTNSEEISVLSNCYEPTFEGSYIVQALYKKSGKHGDFTVCRPLFKTDSISQKIFEVISKILDNRKLEFNIYLFRLVYAASVNKLIFPYEKKDELQDLYIDLCNIGFDLSKKSEIYTLLNSDLLNGFTAFLKKNLLSESSGIFFESLLKALYEKQPTSTVSYTINDILESSAYNDKMRISVTYFNGETAKNSILFFFKRVPQFCSNYIGRVDRKTQFIYIEQK